MKKTNTAARLAEIMNDRKLRQADIIALCEPLSDKLGIKMNSAYLSQVLNGKFEPSQDKILLLSQALNVSPEFLMGWDNSYVQLSPAAMKLVESFNKLNEEGQEMVLNYAEVLDLSGRYKKHDSDGMGIKEA